ncbi:MAG: hypothetical protein ACE5HU_00490 [Acidobacteriota bacterium]
MKYRHRGYRDSEFDKDKERKKSSTPRSPAERQLRHMMERSARLILRCPQCNADAGAVEGLTPEATCSSCGAALHVCRSCAHLDTGARWECNAPITEQVLDKTAANNCSFFRPNTVLDATGRRAGGGSASNARAAFDNLFKKK